MSTALAISAVTAALRNLLTTGVHADSELSDADVTTAPPSKTPKVEGKNEINVFLYSVTPNAGWSNLEPPTSRPGVSVLRASASTGWRWRKTRRS